MSVVNSLDVSRLTAPHFQVVLWQDIFVLIDDGRARAADYPRLGKIVTEQAKRHAEGIGGLTVIPANARPPSQEAREAISAQLIGLGDSLRCACWLVEGGGFQGAMVRAVLTGLKMFGRYTYPTHVSTHMDEAVSWILPHLVGGTRRLKDVTKAVEFIAARRAGPDLERALSQG